MSFSLLLLKSKSKIDFLFYYYYDYPNPPFSSDIVGISLIGWKVVLFELLPKISFFLKELGLPLF
jgi:hypothetical protein